MCREKLWHELVHTLQVPADLVLLIKNLYVNSRGVLQPSTPDSAGIQFVTSKGVK